jgi:hypothetical protein
MVYFQTKDPNLGQFWSALDLTMLIYFMPISNILRTFVIFYDHWVHFVFIWYIFSVFGIMHQEKSGNPDNGGLFRDVGVWSETGFLTNEFFAL